MQSTTDSGILPLTRKAQGKAPAYHSKLQTGSDLLSASRASHCKTVAMHHNMNFVTDEDRMIREAITRVAIDERYAERFTSIVLDFVVALRYAQRRTRAVTKIRAGKRT